MIRERLFHISDDPAISIFEPRPSPSFYDAIRGDVVWGIADRLLHNYLLPRDCPRVGYYAGAQSSDQDIERFLGTASDKYVLAVEKAWMPRILSETIYCYELPPAAFELLDDCAGYYISYQPVTPMAVREISNIPGELLKRDIELRIVSSLWPLADAVRASSLNYSCIRMRNGQLR